MDLKKAEALRKKYWAGMTSLEDEKELKKMAEQMIEETDSDVAFFNYLNKTSAKTPLDEEFDNKILKLIDGEKNKSKTKIIILKYWYIAASLALIISASIIFKNRIFNETKSEQVVRTDTFDDPEKAFEETKKALLFLSEKLNQSSEYATQFSKFEQSQEILKQN